MSSAQVQQDGLRARAIMVMPCKAGAIDPGRSHPGPASPNHPRHIEQKLSAVITHLTL
jgi:hypothetical protein